MSDEIIDVEVIRFEPASPDGTLDYYQGTVKALCEAFGLNFKIITLCMERESPVRMYDVLLSTSAFFIEDTRSVIKTFILHHSMALVNVSVIKMDLYELLEMPQDGISVVENIVQVKPKR